MPSKRELDFWARVTRRAAQDRPDMIRAITKMIGAIRARLTDAAVARLVEGGFVNETANALLSNASMDAAAAVVRAQVLGSLQTGAQKALGDLGNVPRGTISAAFNVLDPRVIAAVQALDSKVITDLKNNAVIVVRREAEAAIRAGVNPRAIAARLRAVVGLGPTQVDQVANYRRALEEGDVARALRYVRRDARFDATVRKGDLTPAQIDKMVTAYTNRRIGLNAEAVARTATLDAMKAGQHLAIQQGIEMGFYDESLLMKVWVTVGDERVRDEHVAMSGEMVPYDQPYSNGEMVPGESTYNCRCISQYVEQRQRRAA